MKTVNSRNVKLFVKAAETKFDVYCLRKTSRYRRVIEWAVEAIGVECVEKWMERWSISLGRLVWLSFNPGVGTIQELYGQIATICHELIHTSQWRGDRGKFIPRYLFSRSQRAHYEADALHANVEMAYALGNKPDIRQLCQNLKEYKLRSYDIAITRKHLSVIDKIASKGGRTDPVTKWACKWWGIK